MRYVQWVESQNSLFHELSLLETNGVIEKLGVEQLDFYYLIQHSNKELVPTLVNKTTKELAKMIHNLYANKWHKLYEIAINDLPIGFDSSSTNQSDNNVNSDKQINTTNVDQTSVHNEDELIDTSGEIDSLNELGVISRTTTTTIQNINIKSIDIQRMLLENSDIAKNICSDISSLISLHIY